MRKHVFGTAVAAALALAAGVASATPFFYSGGGPVDNVDKFAGTTHTIIVAPGAGTITDLNVTVAFSAGVWEDLDITLSNGTTTVFLLAQSQIDDCCFGGTFNVTFDDEAATSVTGTGERIGSFRPEGTPSLLSAFDGQFLTGTWTLSITEIYCCQDESDGMTWSISGDSSGNAVVPEPGTLALLGLGLLGLGGLRRKLA